jgi:hypothetical protein
MMFKQDGSLLAIARWAAGKTCSFAVISSPNPPKATQTFS